MSHKRRKKSKKSKKAAKSKAAEGDQKSQFPRLEWSRSPVQRPHSTPKGLKGYDRKRAKDEVRKDVGDE